MGFASSALAAPPAAGTVIGNQAVATFESGGQTFSVTSNLVQTTINTIAGVQIETDTTKSAVAGGKVLFPHTITNVGNAADRYDLTTSDFGTGLSFVGIYADGDCDGVPDTLTSIDQTGSLNAGESACVVVEVNVAAGTTGSPTFKITAASTLTTAGNFEAGTPNEPNDFNTDTVSVTTGAVFEFTKTMSLLDDRDGSSSVTPGDTVRVRFNYSNTGGADATKVIITDLLPGELTYVAGTGRWSDGGTMTDTGGDEEFTNGQGHTISYSFGDLTVKATLSAVPVGRTGYIEFVGAVATGAAGTISNTGTIDSDQTDLQTSNEARLVIDNDDAIGVTLADTAAANTSYDGRPATDLPDDSYFNGSASDSTTDEDGESNEGEANDAIAYVTTYLPSSIPVPFEVIITNHSNAAQRFDLSVATGNFPAGTTFNFATTDGAPVLDTNSNGRPDVQVGANSVAKFFVRANLPDGAARSAGAEPAWEATVTATAVSNPAVSNRTRLRISSGVGGGTVDLQNAGELAAGLNVDNDGAPWTTVTTNPGQAAEFTLVVKNNRSVSDSFNLSFSGSNFAPGSMPAGWQVVFRNADGTVTNTGVIAPGGSATFTAVVTPPATAAPGNTDVYFRAASASSAAVVDTKLDRVTVGQVVDLSIRTDQTAQAAPGGVVVMTHTLENLGNVAITNGPIGYNPDFPSFAETLRVDANGNGVLDSTDATVTSIANILTALDKTELAPGDRVLLFSRVQAPASAVGGLSESARIIVSSSLTAAGGATVEDENPSNNTVTETVTIVSGNVVVIKEQAVDADCNGTADSGTAFSFTQAGQAADPGACVVYRITATNMGTADATELRIDDATPAYTTYVGSSGTATTGASEAELTLQPADGATGAIRSTHGTLAPGQVARLTFRVRIDQ
ncbi:NEW3 domain-containing protein [Ensifer sp. D2-11]